MKNEEKILKTINQLIDHSELQYDIIVGLQAKVDALITAIVELSKLTKNSEIINRFDENFWIEFQKQYKLISQPSEFLKNVHESLSQISKQME